MNMNPAAVARNRTARLAAEATRPVYTSQTGDKPRWERERALALPKHHNGRECEDC